MKRFFLALSIAATSSLSAQGRIPIVIQTSAGTIEAELDSARAPITVINFLHYMDAHLLDNGAFFRAVTMTNQPNNAVKIEVIQSRTDTAQRGRGFPPIPLERTNATGLTHHDGTLSMARSDPNTATNQFFITIGEQPELDFGGKRNADGQGFAAFGRVTKGMDVVRKIQSGAVNGQNLLAPVRIIRIARR